MALFQITSRRTADINIHKCLRSLDLSAQQRCARVRCVVAVIERPSRTERLTAEQQALQFPICFVVFVILWKDRRMEGREGKNDGLEIRLIQEAMDTGSI